MLNTSTVDPGAAALPAMMSTRSAAAASLGMPGMPGMGLNPMPLGAPPSMGALEEEYLRNHEANTLSVSARMSPPTVTTPSGSKKPMISLSPACNFEAFSLHFHLPLKAAAEKFGVRATAFKKRCRAIGIRHWPYRKVRSLKRSLQELNRCKDQGALNEKQQYQYATFKKQLDKLMSPETYGIDPSGHITQQHFDDDEEDSGDDDGSYTTTQSPRYGASFSECSISPAEGEKTFGDFSQPVHLRSLRKQQSTFLPSAHLNKPLNPPPFMNDLPALRMGHKDAIHPMNPFYNKYPFGGSYDHYLHDPMGLDNKQTNAMKQHMDEPTDDPQSMGSQMPDNQAASSHPEFLPSASADVKYDEVRPLHDSNEEEFNDHTQHIDYSSERFFDDVFLQISPDYGCLV